MSTLSRFRKIKTQDKDLNQVQEQVQQALNPIINSPIVDGRLLRNVCLTANEVTLVKHGLGRELLGYIIVRKREDVRIWDLQDENTTPTRNLALVCAPADTRIDIWVF